MLDVLKDLYLLNPPKNLTSDFKVKFLNSHISGMDISNWFETTAEMNKKMNVNTVNWGIEGKFVCVFHQAGGYPWQLCSQTHLIGLGFHYLQIKFPGNCTQYITPTDVSAWCHPCLQLPCYAKWWIQDKLLNKASKITVIFCLAYMLGKNQKISCANEWLQHTWHNWPCKMILNKFCSSWHLVRLAELCKNTLRNTQTDNQTYQMKNG